MKLNRFIIIGIAAVVVAGIALLLTGRDQTETKPVVSKEVQTLPKTEETPVVISKKSPMQAAGQSKSFETDASPETIIPQAVSDQMEPFAEDSDTEELTQLVSEELEVDWDEAVKHPRLDDSMLSVPQKEQVANAPVPVLLPDRPNLIGAALITTGPEWYAAQMTEDDVSVYVSGNSKVVRVPGSQQIEPPGFDEAAHSLNRSEGIVEISFKAFGIYYTLSVECYDHENDLRCAGDDYAAQLADELKLAPSEDL